MSQQALADVVGVSQSTFARWESGEQQMSAFHYVCLRRYLKRCLSTRESAQVAA